MFSNRLKLFSLIRTLLEIPSIGPHKVARLFTLIQKFGIEDALTIQNISNLNGFSAETAKKIVKAQNNFKMSGKKYEEEAKRLDELGINFITLWEQDYPIRLKNIFAPPLILYYIGDLSLSNSNCVAIVGTRRPSLYGKKIAAKYSTELSKQGITIVSGLARGIDSIAHKASLKNSGKTIAVTGSGIDVIYPPENKELYYDIAKNGLIISEYPIGTKPDAQNFPKRNRIISGLSLGTLIVETRIQGGAMHTAEYALDQGREVFAIPGNIDSVSSGGTNLLIKKGQAKLVQNTEDILVELNLIETAEKKIISKDKLQLNLFEEKIFETLDTEPIHIDIIAERTGMSTADCLVHLLGLEFKGAVRQYPGKLFAKL